MVRWYIVAPCRTYKGWSRKFSRNQNPIEESVRLFETLLPSTLFFAYVTRFQQHSPPWKWWVEKLPRLFASSTENRLRSRPSSSIPVFHPRQINEVQVFCLRRPVLLFLLYFLFSFSLSFSLFEETTRKRRWEKVVFEISSVLLSGFSIFFFFFTTRVYFFKRDLCEKALSLEKKYPEIKYITPPLFRVTSRNTSRFKYKCT